MATLNLPVKTCIFTDIYKHNGEHLTMIDGEYDSNTTLFEKLSNENKIGVSCNNELVGYCLLFFLRIIIDKNYEYLIDVIETVDEDIDELIIDSK